MDASSGEHARQDPVIAAVRDAHREVVPAPSPQEMGRRLYTARLTRDLTQEQLAEAAGVSRNVVIRELEAGIAREQRNPLTLVRLARALGEDWNYLGAVAPATIPPGPGRALATARIARGWTIEELAAKARMNTSSIYKLEHGKTPGTLRTWEHLARVLDVPPDVLNPALA